MLDKIPTTVEANRPSVAVAAFQTAIQQQDEFEQASGEVRDSQREAQVERERLAREADDERAKNSDNNVDIFIPEVDSPATASATEHLGSAVDLTA